MVGGGAWSRVQAQVSKFQKPPEGGAADNLISDFVPGEV